MATMYTAFQQNPRMINILLSAPLLAAIRLLKIFGVSSVKKITQPHVDEITVEPEGQRHAPMIPGSSRAFFD